MQGISQKHLGFFSTIRGRLLVAFLIIGLLPLFVLSFITYQSERSALVDTSLSKLSAVSRLEYERLRSAIEVFDETLETIVTRQAVVGDSQGIEGLNVLAAYVNQTDTAEYQFAKAAVQNEVTPFMSTDIVDLLLLNRSGKVVYSYKGLHEVGLDQSAEPWYGRSFTDMSYDADMDANVITLTAPVINNQQLLGTLVMLIDGQVYSNILTEQNLLDEASYESYIVNSDGLMITKSRFLEDAILNQEVNTRGVNFARSVEDQKTVNLPEAYPDYRGVSVLGAVTPFHDLGWVLVSEIDESDALADLSSLVVLNITVVVLAAGFVLLVAYVVARQISVPITRLTETADAIASGDLNRAVPDIAGGEVGVLAHAFGKMATEVRGLLATMEARVASRTTDLETSSEIASSANQIREMDDLLSLTVNLIRDRFNFYYVQVYLLDPAGEWAILKDGTGYVGRRLLVKNHRLPMDGKSLVARSIKSGKLQVVQDVTKDPDFFANELLPDTRSELTVPLRSQESVIGVLDIQHSEVNPFDESGLQLFQTLADQLAVTFENVQLFQDTEKRSRELETVAEVSAEAASNLDVDNLLRTVSNLTRDNFRLYHAHIYLFDKETNRLVLRGGAGEVGLQMVAQGRSIPMDHPNSIVAKAARTLEGVIVNDVTADPNFLPHELLPKTRAEMAVPMVVGDELIGVLDTQATEIDHFTEEDVRIKTILSAQIAVAVRNANSFEQTQLALAETEQLYSASELLTSAKTYEDLLASLVNSTALQRMDRSNIFVFDHIWTEENPAKTMTAVAVWEQSGEESPAPAGTVYPIAAFPILYHVDPNESFIMPDVMNDERADENTRKLFSERLHMQSLVAFPMVVGDDFIGLIMGQRAEPTLIASNEIRRIETLVDQVSSLVQNIRLFEQTQKSLAQTARLYNASERLSTVATMQEVLDALIETTNLQHMDRANFMLFDRQWTLDEDPSTATIVAAWERDGELRSRVGTEYPFGAFPMLKHFEWGEPYVIADAENDDTVDETMRDLLLNRLGVRSVVFYQLIVGGERIGFLTGQALTPSNWVNDEEIREIGLLVDQSATVIQNIRLFEQTQQRAAELATVAQVGTEVATSLDINEMLWSVSNIITERFGLYHAHIYVLDDTGGNLVLAAGSGNIGRKMVSRGHSIAANHKFSLVAEAAQKRQSVISNDVRDSDDFLPNPMLPDTRSEMAIPLLVGETLLGVLDVQSDVMSYFTDAVIQVQTTLASQLAVSINNARLYTETQQSQVFLRDVIDSTTDWIYAKDTNFRYTLANKAFAESITGTTPEDVVGKSDSELGFTDENIFGNPEKGITGYRHDDELVLSGQEVVNPHNIAIDIDGNEVILNTLKTPVRDADGNVVGILAYSRDMTETYRQQAVIEKRATELATVAEVGTEVATSLDIDEMLWAVSNLTRDRFGLYHAHIYLLDDNDENLVLSAGAGEAGRMMVSRGHSIPVGREASLVATAARTRKSVISNDVTQSMDFMANPLLPDTRSEMAIPLLVGRNLLGVLDVQSDVVGYFGETDAQVQMTLAAQIAVSLNNARLYTETQRQSAQLTDALQAARLGYWEFDLATGNFLFNDGYYELIGTSIEEEGSYYMPAQEYAERFLPPEYAGIVGQNIADAAQTDDPDFQIELESPVNLPSGEQRIFNVKLHVEMNEEGRVVKLIGANQDITERVQQQEEIRKRATELATVAQVGTEAATTLDINEMLWTVSNLTRDRFGLYHAHVYLLDNDGEHLVLSAGAGEAGRMMVSKGHSIPLDREASLVATAARTRRSVISNDVTEADGFMANPLLPDTRSEMAIPLLVGNTLLGVLDVQSDVVNRFNESDVQIQMTLASQIAVSVNNARLYTEMQHQSVQLADALQVARLGYWEFDLATGNFLFNDGFYELIGTSIEEEGSYYMPAQEYAERFLPPEYAGIVGQNIADAAQAEDPDFQIELESPVNLPSGEVRIFNVKVRVEMNDEGRVVRLIGANQDITERVRQEEEVESSRRFLRGVIDSTPDWIFAKDKDFRYTLVNKGYASEFGMEPEDMVGKTDLDVGFPEEIVFGNPDKNIVGFRADDMKVLAGEEILNPYDVATDSKGNTIILNTLKTPVRDADGNVVGVLGYARDTTELHNRQAEIQQRATTANMLARMTTDLSQAEDEDQILSALYPLLKETGVNVAALSYVDVDDAGEITLANIQSVLGGDGKLLPLTALPTNVLTREEYPFIDLIAEKPYEPLFIEDFDNSDLDDAIRAFAKASGFATTIALPIKRGDDWLGIITMGTPEPTVFSDVVRELAETVRPTVVSVVASRLAFIAEEKARRESEQRANELRTVADVSTTTTTILDLNTLLQSVTDLTKDSFGLYHAHIYLLDQETENLVLAGGAGDIGRTMRDRGHSIPLASKNSLVARTARNRKGVIANNVRDEAIFLPNPMLPDTRSEMAVPMVVGDELLGVLDVQSEHRDWFNEQYLNVLTLLAEQVSIAVRNAQAFDRERKTIARLKEVDRLKQQFLANMSHELRTPLNSIIGYAEVLLDGVDGELTEDAVEDVEAIHDSGKHLLSIINEILDLAKIEAGQMQLDRKPLSLAGAVEEIVRSGQILVKDKPVELLMVQEDESDTVFADQVRLRQIMWNLVSNAIKFTEEGNVTVRFGLHPEEENMAYIRIEDTGIGMTSESLEIIFERFRQADGSSTRRAGGTGLGLAITRQLINMHGGEVYVESEPGVGSVFWFTMPLHVAEKV